MAEVEIWGLASCDSTRKARRALEAAGRKPVFRDIRAQPPEPGEISGLWQRLGPGLLNRASTTWRGLSEEEKAMDPVELLVRHPSLMKRPLVRSAGIETLGWTPAVERGWLD